MTPYPSLAAMGPDAARLGYRVGILQSSEAGHHVYQALGFADLGGTPLFVRIPA